MTPENTMKICSWESILQIQIKIIKIRNSITISMETYEAFVGDVFCILFFYRFGIFIDLDVLEIIIRLLFSSSLFFRITFCHLPFQSKWLYIGSERGNIHIVNVESFTLSGYTIMWNKAIEL